MVSCEDYLRKNQWFEGECVWSMEKGGEKAPTPRRLAQIALGGRTRESVEALSPNHTTGLGGDNCATFAVHEEGNSGDDLFLRMRLTATRSYQIWPEGSGSSRKGEGRGNVYGRERWEKK